VNQSEPVAPHNAVSELWAVVPAAGSGTRLPSACPKQYLALKDRSILQRAIDTLLEISEIKGVVVVLSKNDTLWQQLPASKHPQVLTTTGGRTRAGSVVAGLNLVCEHSLNEQTMVLVHDAARALTASSDIQRLVDRVMQAPDEGGLLATRVQDTLKRSRPVASPDSPTDTHSEMTLCREGLWNAQTPQMFRARLLRDTLLEHSDAVSSGDITDEACAMEKAGYAPALVEALHPNFKITHSRDLDMALALVDYSERCDRRE